MYKKYVVVEGNAYSRGVQIGKELKNQISINYQNQTKYYRDKEDFNYRKWGDMAKRYIPAMEKWTPEVMEEIKGMAEGAQMELEQILALTTAYEKSFSRDMISEKCTSFLLAPKATYAQKVIVGQTNEECILEWMNELDTVIHHVDNGKESLIYTHPGVPAYTGINNQGLAVLWEYIDNGRTGNGVPTNAIIRHLLECANVGEAVEFLKMVPHDVPNEFGIADKSGKIVSVECFPNKVYVGRDEKYLVHTNHIVFGKEENRAQQQRMFIEVKGVTLEENGVAMFPDAPTERGIKHLDELAQAVREWLCRTVIFVIQMRGVTSFTPNRRTHAAFAEALQRSTAGWRTSAGL